MDRELVFLLYKKGHKQNQIAKKLGVTRQRIHQIIRNYRTITASEKKKLKNIISKFCDICGDPANQVHHIDKNSLNNDPKNIMSVCESCHRTLHFGYKNELNRLVRIYLRPPRPRILKICPYCKKSFFPKIGKERQQIYCKPAHRKNAFKKNQLEKLRQLVGVSGRISVTSPNPLPSGEAV
jgi:predicted transcriptional regulator